MFTQEELKNISILINLAQIKGSEATTVAILQQKINQLITPILEKEEDKPSKK